MKIRLAGLGDCPDILAIYAQYIDTSVTFEYELPTQEQFLERMKDIMAFYPYLAAEEDGKIIGYAYAHRAQERAAYQWNAELSVYVARGHRGKGAGKALYCALIGLLRLQGVRTAYGIVTAPNARSEALHEALSFREAGRLRCAGYKCGMWRDVIWFEKELSPHCAQPDPPLPVNALQCGEIQAVLEKYSDG